jgi:RNA recognition motif-containing protein
VDYSTTPEELATFFQSCGKVARVTIPGYQHGTPQGYAYLEFEALEGVAASLASMNGASFKGRDLKVKNNTATTQKLVAGGDV